MLDEIIMYHRRQADDTRYRRNHISRKKNDTHGVETDALDRLARFHDKAADFLIAIQRKETSR